jgi:hypothetical protein
MKDQDPREFDKSPDEIVDHYLRSLSDRNAPSSLMPRVQKALAARAFRPWWQRSFDSWNRQTQVLFLSLACFFLVMFGWAASVSSAGIGVGWETVVPAQLISLGEPLWVLISALVSVVQSITRQIPVQIYYVLGGLIWLGYLFTVGTGALLCRLVQLQNTR